MVLICAVFQALFFGVLWLMRLHGGPQCSEAKGEFVVFQIVRQIVCMPFVKLLHPLYQLKTMRRSSRQIYFCIGPRNAFNLHR
jgi:hypothetical protein